MRCDVPAVRIWPMSDRLPGFVGLGVADVQRRCFGRDLPARGGRFRYRSTGLSAPSGTVVLFQFKARIVASAVFLRDEKFDRPRAGCAGAIHLDVATIRTFRPLDLAAMRRAWPGMGALGHVKQRLNPAGYAIFRRRLRGVTAAGRSAAAGRSERAPVARPVPRSPRQTPAR